jgi:hypothetical protein
MLRNLSLLSLGFSCLLAASVTFAQEPPKPDAEAVDATHPTEQFNTVQEKFSTVGPDGRAREVMAERRIPVVVKGYRSPTLKGSFLAQWMYIIVKGRMVTFWGARITSLDAESPLRTLGVRAGDVITRLDGVPIWNNMSRDDRTGIWRIPELERHFSATEVRFILRGSHTVRAGEIQLDTFESEEDNFVPLAP